MGDPVAGRSLPIGTRRYGTNSWVDSHCPAKPGRVSQVDRELSLGPGGRSFPADRRNSEGRPLPGFDYGGTVGEKGSPEDLAARRNSLGH